MIGPFLTSLGCPEVLGHTRTHCQNVAQLKLRMTLNKNDNFIYFLLLTPVSLW